jgi:alkanesulfonate monooxygenase SsuD/methylene tetrahydromethanopterin reductase-like flavin-dependent oxidoreductase (luciferase family)
MRLGLFLMPATLPGRPLSEALDWNLEVIRRADACGYDEAWIGQHFTTPWEPVVAPQQLIARALGETKRIILGTGVEVLYNSHPVRLALELAQLDHLARGRLLFGFGAGGTPTDFQLYGIDPRTDRHQDMMREALRIILDCWKPGGPGDFEGRYWTVRRPRYDERYSWHVEPYAPAQERIAFAGFMPKSGSMRMTGEGGYIPLTFHVAPENVAVHWDSVLEGAAKTGRTPGRHAWRQARDIYVAENEAEARKAALEGCMGRFWDRHFRLIAEKMGILDLFRRRAAPRDVPADAGYMIAHGTWFVGTPDRVAAQILEQHEMTGGFGTLLQIGYDYSDAGAREGWFRSMELLAKEVMPRVNARLAAQCSARSEPQP